MLWPFVSAEARPWYIRYAESMALSSSKKEAKAGMALLRQLYPERELHMECADPRAAGLAGLFIPIKPGGQRHLYFALTGKPYSFHETDKVDLSSMPDDYLSSNIVGDEVTGLTLERSTMTGSIHPLTMSGTIDWTFVFKNDTSQAQEVRAEIALPPGAAISGLTSWTKGKATEASFFASGKIESTSGETSANSSSPATIADLGRNRVLLHAYPVPPEDECKVRITMVVPLKPEQRTSALVVLPHFIASNFGLSGDHLLMLQSTGSIKSNIKGLTLARSAQKYAASGTLTEDDLRSARMDLEVLRPSSAGTVAVIDHRAIQMAREAESERAVLHKQDERAKLEELADLKELRDRVRAVNSASAVEEQIEAVRRTLRQGNGARAILPIYDVETVERISAAAPTRLMVVIDGSAGTAEYVQQISTALKKLPAGISTEIIIASQEDEKLSKPMSLPDALQLLKPATFIGGQDNLKSVIDAAEMAGSVEGGAVLWIHGPQPTLNHEIYIMPKYVQTPSFYELTLGTANIDTLELFSNHPEVGPFVQVPNNSKTIGEDMVGFFSRWTPENSNYSLKLAQTTSKPAAMIALSKEEQNEVLLLYASQVCQDRITEGHLTEGAQIAARYGFVSPVSYASVNNAPTLQGATNGTIGPQGSDATVISSVNTAGTVRVNNLANLEAMLNIVTDLGETLFGIGGAVLLILGLIQGGVCVELMGQEVEFTRAQRIITGAIVMIFGLSIPGTINWFVASARDANLFS